jgi:hypothetical protein
MYLKYNSALKYSNDIHEKHSHFKTSDATNQLDHSLLWE